MKKLLTALFIIGVWGGLGHSVTFNDIKDDIFTNTHLTAIDGVSGAYYYSAVEGNDNSSQAGFNDKFLTYKDVLTANIGWKNALNGGAVGDIVGGPGLNIDTLLGKVFPTIGDLIKSIPSPKVQALINAGFINLYGGWKTSNGAFDYGYAMGISFKFGS